jgi:hypothetical protein
MWDVTNAAQQDAVTEELAAESGPKLEENKFC